MTYQHILYEKREHIASLTVNRPPLNVLTRLTLDELEQALLAARDDPEV
ncbi:MAG: Enoyl-CoA hydratase/isomerase, partial [candidate division NC10 bacterium]|nr:Enoyl-CoA hydratase/isomerase [candidate division NC10 bacterium]